MKNSLRLLSVVLLLTAGAWCQQNITASGSTCATSNACVSSQVTQAQGGATITLAGTFTATVQFEASVDGVTWKAIPSTDATPVTSATGAGVWQFNVAAYTTIRARCSAFTSGPIVVTINTSTASARSGGGGGGGGGGGSPAGPTTAVQNNAGAGAFGDSGCTATGGALVCSGGVSGGPVAHLATYGACSTGATAYTFAGIDDGTTNIIGATVSGGGSIAESVFCNTTAWTCAAGCAATGLALADPGANGIVYRSALNTTTPATAGSIGSMVYAAGTGTGNGQIVTLSPVPAVLVVGMAIRWNPSNANTGAATLNLNGLNGTGAPLVKSNSAALVANDLVVNNIAVAIWDGTNWELQNPQTVASGSGGNHNIDLIAGAAQLTLGCSINGSFLTNTQPTCLFVAGSATQPQQAFPQFTVAGTLGTTVTSATALYIGPKTVPSDYTASGNLTIHFAVANPSVITGAETFSVRYAHATPPAVAQPTFVTTDYSTASLTVSGTVNNTVVGTATITSPSLTAGDQVWFVVYLSAKTATDNPYLTQLYMSY